MTKESSGVLKVFKRVHGTNPTKKIRVRIVNPPSELVVIGKLHSFVYEVIAHESEKGKGELYEHEVGDLGRSSTSTEIYVCVDKTGKHLFFPTVKRGGGGKYPTVNERGIVG